MAHHVPERGNSSVEHAHSSRRRWKRASQELEQCYLLVEERGRERRSRGAGEYSPQPCTRTSKQRHHCKRAAEQTSIHKHPQASTHMCMHREKMKARRCSPWTPEAGNKKQEQGHDMEHGRGHEPREDRASRQGIDGERSRGRDGMRKAHVATETSKEHA